ncbi:MAG: hypothetical protein ACM3O8_15415 [Methylococcaceae bacterium]
MKKVPGLVVLVISFIAYSLTGKAAVEGKPWMYQLPLESGEGILEVPVGAMPARICFLQFGQHSYEPDSLILEMKEQDHWKKIGDKGSVTIGTPIAIDLFQELKAIPWSIHNDRYQKEAMYRFRVQRKGGLHGKPARDAFWDQVIVLNEAAVAKAQGTAAGSYRLTESGTFGESLPPWVRAIHFTPDEIKQQKAGMTDPVMDLIDRSGVKELSWKEIASQAFPLDYQKILLAGINDPDPGFVYQNGQWFVTWTGSEGTAWNNKKDYWFAPALCIGNEIIRPAPLSARAQFLHNKEGRMLPLFRMEWEYRLSHRKVIKVSQDMFSETVDGVPQLFVQLTMDDPTHKARLVLGQGKRPYVHFLDGNSTNNTPIPFFTTPTILNKKGEYVLADEAESVVMRSSAPLHSTPSGLSETLIEFDENTTQVYLAIPQFRTGHLSTPITRKDYRQARLHFEEKWNAILAQGARAELPSAAWTNTIDSWLTQVLSITKINYWGREQLSYGAYFYKDYFGIEEGWPVVALAQWGKAKEAQQEAELLLSKENLDKSNYHHQYRNGLSSWYAASVARLTGDREWLRSISPAMLTNGYWTLQARKADEAARPATVKGILPSHIYGGDISTPAYSLYSSATCLKGLLETADVFHRAGLTDLQPAITDFNIAAVDFKKRLTEVINEVADKKSSPVFLPFAIELNHREGNNEGPYNRLTEDPLGNYWNLFAPLFLHLEVLRYQDPSLPSEWITDYAEQHGGHFGGLPRFYSGLDAVYAVGTVNELAERSKKDIAHRTKTLAALESFMIHACSQNGHTVPEVSGFYPERLDRLDYERVVREAPWNFGMYSADRYLKGYNSFTEPLGAGAGEGLMLIRKSLVDEMKDANGLPNGGIFFLSAIPGEWLKEGKEIKLTRFPTAYGTFDLHVKSFITSKREIQVDYRYSAALGNDTSTGKQLQAWNKLDKLYIRLVPSEEDRAIGRKLMVQEPVVRYDEWTVQLPVMDKGSFILKY